MDVRPETQADISGIRSVTVAAFGASSHGYQNEAEIIDALRKAGALTVSLVAFENGTLAGHVAFSPVMIDGRDCGWFGLGPVAVDPHFQGKGIGQALILEGLRSLRYLGAMGCVVLGDLAYYRRFGFKPHPGLKLDGVPPAYFQQLAFGNDVRHGTVTYHAAFDSNDNSRN